MPKCFAQFLYGPTDAETVWGAPGNRPRSGAGCSARQAAEPHPSHCVTFLLVIQAAEESYTCVCCPTINEDINRYISTHFRVYCPLKVSLMISCLGLTLVNAERTERMLLRFNRQCLDLSTLKTPLQEPKHYCNFYIYQPNLKSHKICLAQHSPFSMSFPISLHY